MGLAFNGTSDARLTITAAEFFVGVDPGLGSGTGIVAPGAGPGTITLRSGAFGASTLNAAADLGFAPNGTVFVRVRDSNGTWSAAVQAADGGG